MTTLLSLAIAMFIGSIAWAYEKEIREAASQFNINIGTINRSPMNGLKIFHN